MKRRIAFIKKWTTTAGVGLALGMVLPLIIVLLEPFDSAGYTASLKYLRLFGYAGVIAVLVLLFHRVELRWYAKNNNRWVVLNELCFLIPFSVLIVSVCSLYNFYVINNLKGISFNYFIDFMTNFGLPFLPIMTPLWAFLRSHFGTIDISSASLNKPTTIRIQSDNKSEHFDLQWDTFLYVQAQQNYVEFYFLANNQVTQTMIRSSLSKVLVQLPEALQVHRSFAINKEFVLGVQGNSRKRELQLDHVKNRIPISKKYYQAFQNQAAI